ncbi:hypothetical protein [Thalassobacillus pellis]|uniref:hypothetical protein n=1 Tax=Thalassobacillus pellis TaxID=748008 RepID=UPI001961A927|nr:hypothetical protein [Thalassobacillus pellis]MBM7553727.1 hypothetical protein [Thalassobacillus pellis]
MATKSRKKKKQPRNKMQFIFRHGVIGWGIPSAILFTLLMQFFEYGDNYQQYFSGNWISSFFIYLITFMLVGALYGLSVWHIRRANIKKKQS